MSRRHDLVVMGDVNWDTTVASFLPYEFREIASNRLTFAPIEEACGGSALIFCLKAAEAGFTNFLLSKVGDDLTGQKIREEIRRHPLIEFPESLAAEQPTGHAVIVRDRSQVRLLVNNEDNANFHLQTTDVEGFAREIAACKALHVSGYCLKERSHPRFQATLQAMEIARRGQDGRKPAVILDVVPHRIYENFSFPEFHAITQNVDILVSEVATLRRFLGLGDRSETIDRELAFETLTKASQVYQNLVLRFGPSGCDSQIAWRRGDRQSEYLEDSGHSRLDPARQRGFGDILTLNALKNFYHVI
jgi:sugar/nucleoside kinase (ribokinase family)